MALGAVAPVGGHWLGHQNVPPPIPRNADILTVTYPTTDLGITVYIAPGADPSANPSTYTWVDITAYVLWASRIIITRGRPDEQSEAPPSSCSLTLKNFAIPPYNIPGIFSPRNPAGPWFGQLGRNTPLRVDIDPGTGPNTRFIGFVPSWPLSSDTSGKFKYVVLRAEGILRRLGQGNTPIRSALTRAIAASSDLVAFWPMEDGSTSTQFASYFSDQAPMFVTGTPTKASDSTARGTQPLPVLNYSTSDGATGYYTPPSAMTQWRTSAVINIPTAPASTDVVFSWTTDGTGVRWSLVLDPTATAGSATLKLQAYDSSGAQLLPGNLSTIANSLFYGVPFLFITCVIPSSTPGSVDFCWFRYPADIVSGSGAGSNGTVAMANIGSVTSIGRTPDAVVTSATFGMPAIFANGGFTSAITGAASTFALGLSGFNNQRSPANLVAICGQEGVPYHTTGNSEMTGGPWSIDTFLNVCREFRDIDNGVLTESRLGVLNLYSSSVFENQAPDLTLDNSLFQLSPDFKPIDDDLLTRNDVTATRTGGGSSSRQTLTTGRMGTATAGKIDTGVQVNTYLDSPDLAIQASYRLVHGTVDESRYPSVKINFARSAASSLITNWLACDIGSRVQILHPPNDQPPDDIDQVIQGYTESFDQKVWDVELNLSPFSPYRVFRLANSGDSDEFLGYLVPDTWTLAAAISSASDTTFSSTASPLLSTDPDDWAGLRAVIRIDGEKMIITGVSGGSNPQTVTVTRGVLGTTAATHAANTTVEFATPGVLGL